MVLQCVKILWMMNLNSEMWSVTADQPLVNITKLFSTVALLHKELSHCNLFTPASSASSRPDYCPLTTYCSRISASKLAMTHAKTTSKFDLAPSYVSHHSITGIFARYKNKYIFFWKKKLLKLVDLDGYTVLYAKIFNETLRNLCAYELVVD